MSIARALSDDLGGGLRQIRRHPGISALVLATLAVCIGANAAVFSVVRTALLDPFGYPQADRVVNVGMMWQKGSFGTMVQEISPRTYLDVAESATCFEALGFVDDSGKADLHLADHTERVPIGRVTAGIWDVVRVPPRLGRVFDAADVRQGRDQVVVLSHDLWARAFGAVPSVLGRELRVDDRTYEVVGVMPAGFSLVDKDSQLWLPKEFSERERSEAGRGMYAFQALGRLREGVSLQSAGHELAALHAAFVRQHPEARELSERLGETYGVARLGDWVGDRSAGSMLVMVQSAALLILLIGCLNVGGVLLVRSRRRSAELALRQAVGATRGRLGAQLLLETLTLFGLGAALGLLLGRLGVAALPRLLDSGEWLRYGRPLTLDTVALSVTLAVSLAVGLLAGCIPALAATSGHASSRMQPIRRGSRHATRWHWAHGAHVSAQIAVSVILLVGALAAIANIQGLLKRGFGVATADRVVARMALPEYRYGWGGPDSDSKVVVFEDEALRRLRALPGVGAVTVATRIPLSREHFKIGFGVEGYTPQPGELAIAIPYGVGPDYFTVLGTSLLKGRALTDDDTASSQPVAVISEGIARRYLAGRDPIGERVFCFGRAWTIVGVVADALDIPLSMADGDSLYFPRGQWSGRPFANEITFVARTARSGAALGADVRAALQTIDPELDVHISAMADLQRKAIVTQRAPADVVTLFGVIAVLLAGLGVYGLLAASVSERLNEIGVRMALGASRRSIATLILSRAGLLSVVGVGVGVAVALYLCRLVNPLLTEIDATSPAIWLTAAGLVLGMAMIAAYVPARRASRVDPAATLRSL